MERIIACCENCKRQPNSVSIERYSVEGHTAYLCPTCAYILLDEKQLDRFFDLCRQPVNKKTNGEMKKVHSLLSRMILVGVCLVVFVVAWGVTQFESEPPFNLLSEQEESYLSFADLHKFNYS